MRKKSMNKAVKSLSLALALSMGFTLLPGLGTVEAEAAAKSGVVLHGKKTVFSAKKGTSAYIGEKKVDLDLIINGKNVAKRVKWSSAKGSVVKVDKNGKLTAKKNGNAVITAVYKNKKYKALVKVFTRAESMTVEDNGAAVTEVNLIQGQSKTLTVNYKLSDKVVKAGGVSSTYNTYLNGDGSDVVTLAKDKPSSTTFTITANKVGESYVDLTGSQSSLAKSNSDKKKVTAKIKVVVAGNFAGKQTGAKKITVTGMNLTNNVKDYVVKSGSNTRDITSVTLNQSATEAVLEMTANITDGDYSVEFGGKTSAFKGETAKLAKINVPSKDLVLKGDNSSAGGTIEYSITNQFGEDVTKTVSGLNVNVSAGTATANPSTGLIDVTGMAANLPLNTPVTLNINKADGTNVITETFNLTVAAKSKASSVSIKGVYSTDTKKPYNLAVNNTTENAKARLLIEVKDQYGRKMKSTDGVNILAVGGLTGLGINGTTVYNTMLEVDGVDYIAIPFTGVNAVKSGDVTVKFIALYGTSGSNTAETTIKIAGTKQVSKFSATAPSEIYAGETAYFNYSATNDAGQQITDYATLTDANYGVKLPEAFSWENTGNGTAKLKYDAKKDNTVKNVSWSTALTQIQSTGLFTVAANMQPVMLQFTVNAPAIPTSLRSLTVDGVLANGTTENVLSKVKVVDNKGRELTDLSGMSNYYLGVKKKSTGTRFSAVVSGATNGTADSNVKLFKLSELKSDSLKFHATSGTAITGSETEDFTFAIYKDTTGTNMVAGSETNVRLTAADLKSLTGFTLNMPSALYSGSAGNDYNAVKIVVVGRASDGSSVQLSDSDISVTDSEGIWDDSAKVLKPSLAKTKAEKGDITDKLRIVINNNKGTDVIEKAVTISNKAPSVTKVEAKKSELSVSALNANVLNEVSNALNITDNYTSEANGVNPSTADAKKTISGIRLVSSSNANLKANWNNTTKVTFSGAAAGDMVTIQVTFNNGVNGTFNFKLV